MCEARTKCYEASTVDHNSDFKLAPHLHAAGEEQQRGHHRGDEGVVEPEQFRSHKSISTQSR